MFSLFWKFLEYILAFFEDKRNNIFSSSKGAFLLLYLYYNIEMLKFCLCFRLSRKFLEYILSFIWGKRNNTFAQKCWIEKRQRITACTVGDKLKYNLRRFEIFLAVWTTAFRKRKRNISETKYKPIMRCLMYLYKTRFLQNHITDSTHSDSEACATRCAEDDLKYSRI